MNVSPSFSLSFSEMLVHSGDLERSRVSAKQENKNCDRCPALTGSSLLVLPRLPWLLGSKEGKKKRENHKKMKLMRNRNAHLHRAKPTTPKATPKTLEGSEAG